MEKKKNEEPRGEEENTGTAFGILLPKKKKQKAVETSGGFHRPSRKSGSKVKN